MIRDEADAQVTALSHRLGLGAAPPLPVRAVIGEASLRFDFVDALARASLLWAHDLFARAVETAPRSRS